MDMQVLRMCRGMVESDAKAANFADADAESTHLIDWLHNAGALQLMGTAQEKVMRAVLNWQASGISPNHPQFETYFAGVEERLRNGIQESIDHDIKHRTKAQVLRAAVGADEGSAGLLAEIHAHAQHAHRLCSLCCKFALPEVEELVAVLGKVGRGGGGPKQSQPLFVMGTVGAGKSVLVAQVAQRLGEMEHQRQCGEDKGAESVGRLTIGRINSVRSTLSDASLASVLSPKLSSDALSSAPRAGAADGAQGGDAAASTVAPRAYASKPAVQWPP